MTRDEYIKSLQKWEDYSTQINHDYGSGYSIALQEAISLAKKLDESKKVVIPQFVADWIEEYRKDFAPLGIVHQIVTKNLDKGVQNHWRNDEANQKLLLNAIANGYEVEKEIAQYVKFKGLDGCDGYLNYDVNFKEFFVDTIKPDSDTKIKFTESWLKDNWPGYKAYNNAGLLGFEEV